MVDSGQQKVFERQVNGMMVAAKKIIREYKERGPQKTKRSMKMILRSINQKSSLPSFTSRNQASGSFMTLMVMDFSLDMNWR